MQRTRILTDSGFLMPRLPQRSSQNTAGPGPRMDSRRSMDSSCPSWKISLGCLQDRISRRDSHAQLQGEIPPAFFTSTFRSAFQSCSHGVHPIEIWDGPGLREQGGNHSTKSIGNSTGGALTIAFKPAWRSGCALENRLPKAADFPGREQSEPIVVRVHLSPISLESPH